MPSIEPQPSPFLTPEEYLVRERAAEFKSEYLFGQVYAKSGGSPEHAAIAINVGGELRAQLRGKPCQVFSSELKVRIRSNGLFAYPDLSVACGELEFHDGQRDVLTNPTLIVEVLSPSTENYDRGSKFFYYRQIEALQEYLLVSQHEPYIDHYKKEAEGRWTLTSAAGLASSLALPSIGVTLDLAEIYEKIAFPSPLKVIG